MLKPWYSAKNKKWVGLKNSVLCQKNPRTRDFKKNTNINSYTTYGELKGSLFLMLWKFMLKNGTKFIYRETDKETLNLVLKYLEDLPLEVKQGIFWR